MTTQRPHRSLEEWQAIQAERAKEPPVAVKGHSGSVLVNAYGTLWQAPSVAELRAEGFEVIIHHAHKYRPYPHINAAWLRKLFAGEKYQDQRGGRTYVTLLGKDGRWARGQVKCHVGDIYSKRIGYVLAVNRALDQLAGQ